MKLKSCKFCVSCFILTFFLLCLKLTFRHCAHLWLSPPVTLPDPCKFEYFVSLFIALLSILFMILSPSDSLLNVIQQGEQSCLCHCFLKKEEALNHQEELPPELSLWNPCTVGTPNFLILPDRIGVARLIFLCKIPFHATLPRVPPPLPKYPRPRF